MVKPKSQPLSFSNSLWLITVLGLLSVMLVMFVTDHRATSRTMGAGSSSGPNPSLIARGMVQNPNLTPGDVLTTDRNQICTSGYTKTVRNVPSSLKRQVYQSYGIRTHKPGDYEIDHLISLELGGSNSVRNLWPESFVSAPLNAHVVELIPSGDALAPQPLTPSELTSRELSALEALDQTLRGNADFIGRYPNSKLVRIDSMRLLPESTSGRYYLRYSSDVGMVEFWGHVSRQARFDLKRGILSVAPSPDASPVSSGSTARV